MRIAVMRATLHLLSADDCLLLRPLTQPVLDAELARHSEHKDDLAGLDPAPVLAHVRELLATEGPRTQAEIRQAIEARFPGLPAPALAYACRNLLAFVQVPPRGLWGQSAQVRSTSAELWLGRELDPDPSIDAVVLRQLAAFGPATVADIASWSRLTGMRAVLERLRPQLVTFEDERGRELFDLPHAPRPDPRTPAPPRLLPEYDNLLLSHADRSRFYPPDEERETFTLRKASHRGAVLSDGRVCGMWAQSDDSEIVVDLAVALSRRAAAAVDAEARRLARFLRSG